jgi:hypothetical protein
MTRTPDPDGVEPNASVRQTAPASKALSHIGWKYFESQPGFNEEMKAARARLGRGEGVPFKEIRGGR